MLIDVCNNTAWQGLGSSCTVDRHVIPRGPLLGMLAPLLVCRAALSEGGALKLFVPVLEGLTL